MTIFYLCSGKLEKGEVGKEKPVNFEFTGLQKFEQKRKTDSKLNDLEADGREAHRDFVRKYFLHPRERMSKDRTTRDLQRREERMPAS